MYTDAQFEEEHYMKSIVVEYVLPDMLWYSTDSNENVDKNIWRRYVCDPIVQFKFATMWLKMQESMSMYSWVPIAMDMMKDVQDLNCRYFRDNREQTDIFYLLMDNVVIRSDMFGGLTKKAKIHFHFENLYVCQQFVKTVKKHYDITKDTQPKFTIQQFVKLLCEKKIKSTKETKDIARILIDEILPVLRKYIPKWTNVLEYRVSQYMLKLDWIAGGTPEQACDSVVSWLNTLT